MKDPGFAILLEGFFTHRLMAQRRASPHTIASYRDTFRLLLQFAHKQLRKLPARLELADLDAPLIGAFLDDLEKNRSNAARSRNLRLTAIRSFFGYAAYEEPAQSGLIQRVLAIPNKRQEPHLGGQAGSRFSSGRRANGSAPVGNDKSGTARCHARHRCSCPLPRQRPKGAMYTTDQAGCLCGQGMAAGT